MSHSAHVQFPTTVLMAKGLSPSARIVWAYLRHRQGENGDSWPSQDTIGRDLGISKSAAGRAIAELEQADLLRVNRPKKKGRGHHSRYQIKGPPADRLKGPSTDPLGQEKVQNRKIKGPPAGSNKNQGITYSPNSDEFRLAKLLFGLIREWKPNYREPDLQKWAVHIDRLIRLDERTPAEVERVIRWSQQDEFWRGNILSAEKLRNQTDTLEAKMGDWSSPQAPTSTPVERDAAGLTPHDQFILDQGVMV